MQSFIYRPYIEQQEERMPYKFKAFQRYYGGKQATLEAFQERAEA